MEILDRSIFRIADYSVANNPESPSREAIVFVFRLLSIVFLTTLLTLSACGILGHFKEGLLVVGASVLIKVFIGSSHFRSIVSCTVVSSASMVLLSFVPREHGGLVVYALSAISIALIYAYAPRNVSVFMRLRPEQLPRLKWVGMTLVALNVVLQVPLVIDVFFFQAVLITPFFGRVIQLVERRSHA